MGCCGCSANLGGFWGISEQAEQSRCAHPPSVGKRCQLETMCRRTTLKPPRHLTDLISKGHNTRWGKTVLSCLRDLGIWQVFSGKSVMIKNLNVSSLPASPSTRSSSREMTCLAAHVSCCLTLVCHRVSWEASAWVPLSEVPRFSQTNANSKLPTFVFNKEGLKTSCLAAFWSWLGKERGCFFPLPWFSVAFCLLEDTFFCFL